MSPSNALYLKESCKWPFQVVPQNSWMIGSHKMHQKRQNRMSINHKIVPKDRTTEKNRSGSEIVELKSKMTSTEERGDLNGPWVYAFGISTFLFTVSLIQSISSGPSYSLMAKKCATKNSLVASRLSKAKAPQIKRESLPGLHLKRRPPSIMCSPWVLLFCVYWVLFWRLYVLNVKDKETRGSVIRAFNGNCTCAS